MTTIEKTAKELQKWAAFIGRDAIIESTGYFGYEKPMIELQRNTLVDVMHAQNRKGNPLCLVFTEKRDKKGYGSLGCIYDRSEASTSFTPEGVRKYTKQKLLKDERFEKIAMDKKNLQVGQKFMDLQPTPHSGGFRVSVIQVTNYSVAKGIQFSERNNLTIDDLYAASELEALLDNVEIIAAKSLRVPIEPKEIKFELNRFIVNTITVGALGKKIKNTYEFDEKTSVEDILAYLEEMYEESRAFAVITDTVENKVHYWNFEK